MGSVVRGLIIRKDQALFDGKITSVTRVDATGGTISGLPINDFVDVLQVFGSGTAFTLGTISAAVNYLGTTVASFLFGPGTWVIDDDITIPSTISNHIAAGCTFAVSSGKTLTFSGPVYVEYDPWFSGSGTVSHTLGAQGFPGY